MVSKAAERSRRQKTGYFLWANGINEMVVNIEKSSFSGVMFTVCRLVRVEKIVRRKVFSKSRFDNTFDDFEYERQVGDRAVVWELILIQGGFLDERRYSWFFKNEVEMTRAERQIDYVGNSRNENRWAFLKKPSRNRIRISLLVWTVEKLRSNFDISDSDARLNEENWWGVTGGEGECWERTEEMASRKRRSLWILSVKKEAKLSAREGEAEEGREAADVRWSSLLIVCQRRRGLSDEEETRSE